MTTLTLFSPSGVLLKRKSLRLAQKRLQAMDFDAQIDDDAFARHQRFAGDDDTRLAALHRVAHAAPSVAMASAGGYGMTRLLDRIDWRLIRSSVDAGTRWVGHSDMTALQLGLLAKAGGGVTWAGPLAVTDIGRSDEAGGLDEFEPGPAPAYFQLRLDDGFLLARSASLGEGNLSGSAEGVTRLRLPDGRWGRVRVMALQPRHPEDAPVPATGRLVQVSVARSTDEIDATLLLLDEVLLGAGLFAMLLAAVAATWIVRSGLQPLGLLARQLDHIDAQRLSERVDRSAHPPELRAAVDKVNELLARLEAAFARARQFNADVSHELRTPLSGLKLILEVALSRERDVESYRVALTRSLKVVGQLSGLVESLLLLARLDREALERTLSIDQILSGGVLAGTV